MTVCVALLCCVVLLRVFFPGAAEAMRATVLPLIEEDMDYRGAIAAIGETITGDTPILEALGEIAIRAFGVLPAEEDVEAAGVSEEPEITPTPSPSPLVNHPPIEEVFPVPALFLLSPPESEEPEAVAAFLAHQEAFAAYAVPVNAAVCYLPLDLDFAVPTAGPVSSPFGFRRHPILGNVGFHFGTDIAANTGEPIYAVLDGRVVSAREGLGFGKYVLLYHGDGIYTRYAHASVLYVRTGDTVARGQMIARVGATGTATGPHLHFELRVDGMYRNAEFYLEFYS